MEKKLELTKEEYIAKYPVGTRILWPTEAKGGKLLLPGVVVEPLYKSDFDPSVWFLLDREKGQAIAFGSRFIGYKYQHLIKLAE